jgi:hypothetical protein
MNNLILRIKNKIWLKISNLFRPAIKSELENVLPIISQLFEFQTSSDTEKSGYYDHTKDSFKNIEYFRELKEKLTKNSVIVEEADININDFEVWQNKFPEIVDHYNKPNSDVFIEKCLEHYLAYKYLNLSDKDIYIDVASAGSPWANILNTKGIKSYRLDLCYPKGINGINIGADAGDTKLKENFATGLSLCCAYECFMGDADIRFVKEADRILGSYGRYIILPLYLDDQYFVSTSPYVDQSKVIVEKEARKVWRDDGYKVAFSRHYSPEGFFKRIYAEIPETMSGRVFYFKNLAELMERYAGQRLYCFFMFFCQKN